MKLGLIDRAITILLIMLITSAFSQAVAVPSLSLGSFNVALDDGSLPLYPGTLDGAAPFNVFGSCADITTQTIEGEDCGGGNGVVRTQDSVSHVWSITADNYDPGAPNLTDVVIEQILTPSTNAVIEFESLPVVCTSIGGGGTNPVSSIVKNANGSSVMTCNLGEFIEGQQKSFTANVRVSGLSWNGSDYSSSQRVYSLGADDNENATGASYADIGPIRISAQPAYDLIRSITTTQGFYNTSSVSYKAVKDLDGDGSLDSEPGLYTYGLLRLAAARKSGVESLQQPIVFQDSFQAKALSENGADYPLELYVNQCLYNRHLS